MSDAVVETPPEGRAQRLLLDVGEVRDRITLRLLASLPAFAGGVWLIWIADDALLRVLALAGLVFAVLWVVRARKSVTQIAQAQDHYLEIGPEALALKAGSQLRSWPWSQIEAVEIDEDRLVVRLRLRGADPLSVEPEYGALGLRELAEAIERGRVAGDNPGPPPGVRSPQS